MSGRDSHLEQFPGHGTPFDWVKPHKPVPDWLRSLPPIEFVVPRWDRPRSGEGACPIVNKSDRPGQWEVRLGKYGIGIRLAHRVSARTPPVNTGIRRHMSGSLARLAWATHVLESEGIGPTHMITLTLPPEAWEARIEELGRDEAVRLFIQARAKFLDALWRRLRRLGHLGAWLWFLEFQEKRQAPHVHILLDLGDRLSDEDYREWADWLTAEWSRVLGVPAPYATRIEALRNLDFRYARKYATKPKQKSFPFPARWGRSWDTAGPWREILRQARREPVSSWLLSTEDAYARLRAVYESLAYQLPVPKVYLTLHSLVQGESGPTYFRGRIPIPPHWSDIVLYALTEAQPLAWDTS